MRKRWRIAATVLSVMGIVAVYLFFYEPPYRGQVVGQETPLLIAHRGFGNEGPDNGISAVHLAIEHGLDGVDLDLQLTADGHLVVFHDPTVDRLTDGSGAVREMSLAQLKSLDMGIKYDAKYAGERIVTFSELLAEVAGKTQVIAELKSGGIASEGVEPLAIEAIRRHDAYDHVILSSFNPFVLRRLKQLDPRVRTMFIFRDLEPEDPTQYRKIPFFLKSETCRRALRKFMAPDLLSIETTVNRATIERLHQRGYPIFLWCADDKPQMQASLERQPFGVITNEPLLALEVMDKQGVQAKDAMSVQ